jgi:hypothetical protein
VARPASCCSTCTLSCPAQRAARSTCPSGPCLDPFPSSLRRPRRARRAAAPACPAGIGPAQGRRACHRPLATYCRSSCPTARPL